MKFEFGLWIGITFALFAPSPMTTFFLILRLALLLTLLLIVFIHTMIRQEREREKEARKWDRLRRMAADMRICARRLDELNKIESEQWERFEEWKRTLR